jgi:hypothetical protein
MLAHPPHDRLGSREGEDRVVKIVHYSRILAQEPFLEPNPPTGEISIDEYDIKILGDADIEQAICLHEQSPRSIMQASRKPAL